MGAFEGSEKVGYNVCVMEGTVFGEGSVAEIDGLDFVI